MAMYKIHDNVGKYYRKGAKKRKKYGNNSNLKESM